jgi:hypothetical protein
MMQLFGLAFWAAAGSALAAPGDLGEAVSAARTAIEAGKPKRALEVLEDAESGAAAAGEVVSSNDVASIFYLRGVAHRAMGDRKTRAPDLWRTALVIDNSLVWDESLIDDGDAFSLFEALRGEVGSRPRVDPGVPEALGAAKAYVDGVRVRSGEELLEGQHLAQITCDDGTVPGQWTTFSRSLNWIKMCPNGIDTTVVVADDSEDDLFGGMFSDMDDGDEEPVAEAPPPSESASPRSSGGRRFEPLPVGLMAGGGVLLTTGLVLNFTRAAPAWAAVEDARGNPSSVNASQATELSSDFETARLLTLATGGLGVGLLSAGVVLQVRSISVSPVPGGVWLRGQF